MGRCIAVVGAALAVAIAAQLPTSARADDAVAPQALDLQAVDAGVNTYPQAKPLPDSDYGLVDATGVRMVSVKGVPTDHPVAQAQYGIRSYESHLLTGESSYLDRAIRQADRIIANKIVSRDAWFFPYPFNFNLYQQPDKVMKEPWYSAMAQGQALSLFVRLARATGDPRWTEAARLTFRSLTLPRAQTGPWVIWTDEGGRFWLEEYPASTASVGEKVLNGHMFAMFGLYDYWVLTKDPQAMTLFRAASATVRATATTVFRWPGWISRYSAIRPEIINAHYHEIHTAQLMTLHAISGDPQLAHASDLFRDDYPTPSQGGRVFVDKGSHVCWTGSGRTRGTPRTVNIAKATVAPASNRERRLKSGVRIRISGGWLSGCWIEERPGAAYLLGESLVHRYVPGTRIVFPSGTLTAVCQQEDGRTTTKRVRVRAGSRAPVDRSALIGGRYAAFVTAGSLARCWTDLAGTNLGR